MKHQLKILLFVFVSLFTSSFYATAGERIPLWGATSYGMTLNELIASVAGARSLPDATKQPFKNNELQALATLDNIEIAGEHFKAWFMFSSGKLTQVTLSLVPKTAEANTLQNADLSVLYSKFTWLLNIKYGSPVKATRQEFGPPISVWYAQWMSGSTNIDLNIDKTHLDISYGTQYVNDLKAL